MRNYHDISLGSITKAGTIFDWESGGLDFNLSPAKQLYGLEQVAYFLCAYFPSHLYIRSYLKIRRFFEGRFLNAVVHNQWSAPPGGQGSKDPPSPAPHGEELSWTPGLRQALRKG